MGCGALSKSELNEITPVNDKHIAKVITLPVLIGKNIATNLIPTLIFIFGGPGSKKSLIVDEILSNFKSHNISISKIIEDKYTNNYYDQYEQQDHNNKDTKNFIFDSLTFDEIINDIKEEITNIMENQFNSFSNIDESSLHKKISSKISRITTDYMLKQSDILQKCFILIDIIPNLKKLLEGSFLKENPILVLQKFEEQFPVSFALNLKVINENLLVSRRNVQEKDGISKGDEVDGIKLQKRLILYNENVSEILQYFEESNRVVEIDTTGNLISIVWQSLFEVISRFFPDFKRKHHRHILLFVFEDSDVCLSISDSEKTVGRIALRTFNGISKNSTFIEIIKKLITHIYSIIDLPDILIIDMRKTIIGSFGTNKMGDKPLLFDGYESLRYYLSNKIEKPLESLIMNRKIFSTVDDYTYIFPVNISDDVCSNIVYLITKLTGSKS